MSVEGKIQIAPVCWVRIAWFSQINACCGGPDPFEMIITSNETAITSHSLFRMVVSSATIEHPIFYARDDNSQ